MKKINTLLLTLAATGMLPACSVNKTSSGSDSSAAATDSSQSTTLQADSSVQELADSSFAAKAVVGGMAEVALGKMAAVKGAESKVKDFGKMMVMDHGKANAELMTITKAKNITLPAVLDAGHQAKSDSLSKLSGKDFDKEYVDVMIDGHKRHWH